MLCVVTAPISAIEIQQRIVQSKEFRHLMLIGSQHFCAADKAVF